MAKIRDLLSQGPTYSFEFMPPRNDKQADQLRDAMSALRPLKPSFVSITYGAGGSTRDRTHDLVYELLKDAVLNPMAHLTCIAHAKEELFSILEQYRCEGLENLLALRGDLPKGTELFSKETKENGLFQHAYELILFAKEIADFSVGVAAHPEGHPHAPDLATDRQHLAQKLRIADFAITQFFFLRSDYEKLIEDLDFLGIQKPILPGIMPPSDMKQLSRMAELSGATIPSAVWERMSKWDDPIAAREEGIAIATELCEELLDLGIPGLHFYTMNTSAATQEIFANLGLPERSLKRNGGGL